MKIGEETREEEKMKDQEKKEGKMNGNEEVMPLLLSLEVPPNQEDLMSLDVHLSTMVGNTKHMLFLVMILGITKSIQKISTMEHCTLSHHLQKLFN